MSLLNSFNSINDSSQGTSKKPQNVAIRVTGFSGKRVFGIRLDTKEAIEAYSSDIKNPNQSRVEDKVSSIAIGGHLLLGTANVEPSEQPTNAESAYVMSTRWATLLTTSAHDGKCLIVNAQINSPFYNKQDKLSMAVNVLKKPHQATSIENFETAFFGALNPSTATKGSIPNVAVRLTELDENGEPNDAVMKSFSPAFLQDGSYGAADIQDTYAFYKNTAMGKEKYDALLNQVGAALDNPSYKVEVVPLVRFGVGSKAKQKVEDQMNNSNSFHNWPVVPTLFEPTDTNPGCSTMIVTLRLLSETNSYICTSAVPIEPFNSMVTSTGVVTKADKRRHDEKIIAQQNAYLAKKAGNNSSQANQQAPRQAVQAQPQSNPQNSGFTLPTPPQKKQAPTETYTKDAGFNESQSFQQPATPFEIRASGDNHFVIIPPNINPDMESSLYANINSFAAGRIAQGKWFFQADALEQVNEYLNQALPFLVQSNPAYNSPIINNMVTAAPELPESIEASAPAFDDINFDDLANEIAESYGSSTTEFEEYNAYHKMNR